MWTGFRRMLLISGVSVALLVLPGCTPEEMNTVWEHYGNNNDSLEDWTGGDGTFSVALPDGRTAWFFSDSFMGTVNADGSRPGGQPYAHNSIVVQEANGGLSETIVDLSGGSPGHFIQPADPEHYYWVGAGTLEGNAVKLVVYEIDPSPTREIVGIQLATLSLPDLEVVGQPQPLPYSEEILWGRQILPDAGFTYIYGVKAVWPGVFVTYVARSPAGNAAGPWEFWTGDPATEWSPNEAAANPVTRSSDGGTIASYGSVIKDGSDYVLVGIANHTDPEIRGYVGSSPAGPFDDGTVLKTIPETDEPCGDGTKRTYAINAHLQFEQEQADTYMVSYNVNCSVFTALLLDVTFYRPRFTSVTLP